MLKTEKEKYTCAVYSAKDETGHVHCHECPLRRSYGEYSFHCKANSHYDKETKEWEYDKE